ncbi:Flp family type IVb pilin [Ornithinimicrobium flavum]|uniref:Flp family type IVb pilin n=1 Tax=Ornithinimicrobium flavum TaxID=1288636 RepID=UPI00106F6766|nr:Flp family type IVb pilin [Ornithinimicrobium flavum]
MAAIFYTLATLKARLVEADKERGATAVEYGIMVAAIAAVIIGIVFTIGEDLLAVFTDVSGRLGGVAETE